MSTEETRYPLIIIICDCCGHLAYFRSMTAEDANKTEFFFGWIEMASADGKRRFDFCPECAAHADIALSGKDRAEYYKEGYKSGANAAAKSANLIVDEKDRQIADLVRQIKQLRDAIANANHILSRA